MNKLLTALTLVFILSSISYGSENLAGIFINNTNPSIEILDTDLKFDGKLAGKLGFIYGFNGVEFSLAPISLYDENDNNSEGLAILLRLIKERYAFNLSYEKNEGYTNSKDNSFDENLESESFTINFFYSIFDNYRLDSPQKFNFGEHGHGPIIMASISKRKLSNNEGILDSETQTQLGLTSNINEIDANLGALLVG